MVESQIVCVKLDEHDITAVEFVPTKFKERLEQISKFRVSTYRAYLGNVIDVKLGEDKDDIFVCGTDANLQQYRHNLTRAIKLNSINDKYNADYSRILGYLKSKIYNKEYV